MHRVGADGRESRTVVFVDAHGIMQAYDKPSFRADMNSARTWPIRTGCP